MRIEAPERFLHADQLSQKYASRDPRIGEVKENLIVDLRGCAFIRPAAVLWCVVYPLLSRNRGVECTLLVPTNMGVSVYLQSLGLFDVLKGSGVEVDDRGIRHKRDPQTVLPITSFSSEDEVERLANDAHAALSDAHLGAANLYPLVSEVFAELALNAVQHSESPIGGYGFIQFFEFAEGKRFVCAVSDGGIGIRRSLERNPEIRDRVPYDWVAIELAVRERVSGTGEKTRGIGLYGVAEDMRIPGRRLIIHSGLGSLQISEEVESEARRATLFPGTLAYAALPT